MCNQLPSLGKLGLFAHLGGNITDLIAYKIISSPKKFDQQITLDVIAFKQMVKRKCREFARSLKTWDRSINRLQKLGLIKIVYKLGFGKYVVEVRTLSGFENLHYPSETELSKTEEEEKTPNDTPDNDPPKSDQEKRELQQQLIYADQITKSVGVIFDKKDLWKVAKFSTDQINKAIAHFKFAREHNHIPSPTGWLLCCLNAKWYKTFRPEKYIASVEDKYFELQDLLLESFGSIPQRLDKPLDFAKKLAFPPAQ